MASNKQRPTLAALKAEKERLLQEIHTSLQENHAYNQRLEQKEAMRRQFTTKVRTRIVPSSIRLTKCLLIDSRFRPKA